MAAQHTRFKAPACDPFCVKFSEFCFCFTTFWYFKTIVHLSFVTKKTPWAKSLHVCKLPSIIVTRFGILEG